LGLIQLAKVPLGWIGNRGFLTYLRGRQLSLRYYTFLPKGVGRIVARGDQ